MNENLNFELGQSLIIELADECFLGEFHFMNKARTRIDLKNVSVYNTNQQVPGIQRFYKPDIRSIIPLKDQSKVITNFGSCDPVSELSTLSPKEKTELKSNITKNELDIINIAIADKKYFFQTDRNYYDAIEEILDQSLVALSIECEYKENLSTISLITIATMVPNIFIFDIISMGHKIPTGLQQILNNNCPRKIIHNSSIPTHILNLICNIQLNSIFDTMVTI